MLSAQWSAQHWERSAWWECASEASIFFYSILYPIFPSSSNSQESNRISWNLLWRKFWIVSNSFRYLYPSQCESIRKTFWISLVETCLKINPIQSEVNFQSKWSRINPDTVWFLIWMILTWREICLLKNLYRRNIFLIVIHSYY